MSGSDHIEVETHRAIAAVLKRLYPQNPDDVVLGREARLIGVELARAGLLAGSRNDPLGPDGALLNAPFHSWVEFVDMVARPMVEADGDPDPEIMRLYNMTSPYYLCVSLVMAAERAKRAEAAVGARNDAEQAVLDAAKAVADADLDEDLSACPYFQRGAPGADPHGTCSYGCRDEPQCQTCIPRDGWPLENLRVAVRALRASSSLPSPGGET